MPVTVIKVLHSRQGVETWVTSDGRAYFVELNETSPSDLEDVDQRTDQVGRNIFKNSSIYISHSILSLMKMACRMRLQNIFIRNRIFDGMGLAFTTLRLPSGCKNGVVAIPRMDKI